MCLCPQALNGDDEEGDEDEEEVVVMGGDQFTPEEIAEAERRFEEAHGRALGGGSGGPGGGTSGGAEGGGPGPVHVLPLYAMLPQVGLIQCMSDDVQGCAVVLEAVCAVRKRHVPMRERRLCCSKLPLHTCPALPSLRLAKLACSSRALRATASSSWRRMWRRRPSPFQVC